MATSVVPFLSARDMALIPGTESLLIHYVGAPHLGMSGQWNVTGGTLPFIALVQCCNRETL